MPDLQQCLNHVGQLAKKKCFHFINKGLYPFMCSTLMNFIEKLFKRYSEEFLCLWLPMESFHS